jgi:hypothetical protein
VTSRLSQAIAFALVLGGCTTERVTEPQESATEQLLVSNAVDHAVNGLDPGLPRGSKSFVDAQYVDTTPSDHMRYPRYFVGMVRDRLLRSGLQLVDDRKSADVVLELRSGAQSIDHDTFMVGLPSLTIPVPLSGTVNTPEIALFKKDRRNGIAKLSITAYRQHDGALAASTGPAYGRSGDTKWTVLLFISWADGDTRPDPAGEP